MCMHTHLCLLVRMHVRVYPRVCTLCLPACPALCLVEFSSEFSLSLQGHRHPSVFWASSRCCVNRRSPRNVRRTGQSSISLRRSSSQRALPMTVSDCIAKRNLLGVTGYLEFPGRKKSPGPFSLCTLPFWATGVVQGGRRSSPGPQRIWWC